MKPESAIQRQVIAYLRGRGIAAVAVPNGAQLAGDGKARAMQMNAMKRDGLMVGFPDLILFRPAIPVCGFVEVKVEGGKLSEAQGKTITWLQSLGHPVAVVRSIEDIEDTLLAWGWAT